MNRKIRNIINKKNKSKIICLTAYSKNIAEIIDNHADIVLVGDSLGSVLYNYDTTRKVTLNMMIEHTKSGRMGVKKSLLVIDMPYNTYRNKGLPPGPIASPGIKSIVSALYPANTPNLYFVSRQDGSHQFSATLNEHNRAVQKYQLRRIGR